ncbi:MAG TPA: DUF222 domain-containing protein [Actinomycetospora sp.]|jgi:hypothetical protein|uniref:HNH endonuclease signature motif containing protein n=1 Tax=Actinomycetospora sp. TaxID=1872135 RepID=UPI002F41EA72
MSSPSAADEAVIARVREAVTAAREAEYALLVALGELAGSGAWEATGHRKPARLVEELCRVDPAHAHRLVVHSEHVLATVTLTGHDVPPRLPHAARLAAAGAIGEEHLRVLVRARERVERIPGIEPRQLAEAEELLAESARSLSPCALERVVEQLLARLDPDGAPPEEEPEPADELLVTRRRDGTLAFTGRVHGIADVELVLETLDALSGPAGSDDPRTLAQRRAEALLDLCDQARGSGGIADEPREVQDPFGDGPVDEDADRRIDWRDQRDEDSDSSHRHGWLRPVPEGPPPQPPEPSPPAGPARPTDPSTPADPPDAAQPADDGSPPPGASGSTRQRPMPPIPSRAQIAVTIPLEWLRERTGHALLDSGRLLDPATARRVACDATVIPVVLGSRSEPVELGRAAYAVTEALRRLLVMRDRGCAHPGCTRRANRCHAHHIRHGVDGGPTDPDNLVLLCRYHHHLVHHAAGRYG